MSRIYLRHHDAADRVLMYDTLSGRNLTLPSDRVPQGRQMDRGFFVDVVGEVYGVYASPRGPVFFHGRQQIPLYNRDVNMLRRPARDGLQKFILQAPGQAPIEVRYRPHTPTHADPWDDDPEFSDFFAWLERSVDQDRFYTWHTVP